MKVKIYLEKDIFDFIEKIKQEKEEYIPDLYIFFLPSFIFTRTIYKSFLKEVILPSECIGISTMGVMKNNEFNYNYFGGLSIKFTKNGAKEFLFIPQLSNHDLEQIKKEVLSFFKEDQYSTYLIFSTTSDWELNYILDAIFKNQNFPNIRLYGGIASSNLQNLDTYITYKGEVSNNGLIILRLKNVISYNTLSFGFFPIGIDYKITKGEKNKIFEINGKTAKDFFENLIRNIGMDILDFENVEKMKILWEFPVLIYDDYGYISSIRTFKKFNIQENSLEFYGSIQNNRKIKLSTGDSEDILNDVNLRTMEFYGILQHNFFKPDVILNISCAARSLVLKEDSKEKEEQILYYSLLNDYPICGFLSFGEIGPDRFGKPGEFFNETSILIGLEEI